MGDAKVNFGYERVSPEEKTERVGAVFRSVAQRYDLMNDLMSCGIHRWWKGVAVHSAALRAGQHVLDLAGGTADMAERFIRRVRGNGDGHKNGQVTVADINPHMLQQGRTKLLDRGLCDGIHWVQADAQALPFADESFDLVNITFGLRNVSDIPKALAEMYRVLKPGKQLMVLEFSHPTHAIVRHLYDLYSFALLPRLGQLVANDADSYRYLVESIRTHPDQKALLNHMAEAGFEQCSYQNLSDGIVAIHRARRTR